MDETSELSADGSVSGPLRWARASSEEFVIEVIQESEEITGLQEAAPARHRPVPPPRPLAADSASPNKLMQMAQGAASWYEPRFYGRTTAIAPSPSAPSCASPI